jgi:quercetin dioxygenase-like cupin family protein
MHNMGRGSITYGEDVETLVFDWGEIKFYSEPAVTGAEQFSFGMVVLKPGKGHDTHDHPGVEEIIYVVSGEGEQAVDGRGPVHIRPGASIHIPPGVPHSTLNTGWEPLRLIVVYSPPGAERGLRDLSGCQVLAVGKLPG